MNTKSMKTETIFIFYYYYFCCQEIQKNFIKAEEINIKNQPSSSIGPGSGHALANFALQRILSEKLHYLCFSQVPAGSDCPYPGPILPEGYRSI